MMLKQIFTYTPQDQIYTNYSVQKAIPWLLLSVASF